MSTGAESSTGPVKRCQRREFRQPLMSICHIRWVGEFVSVNVQTMHNLDKVLGGSGLPQLRSVSQCVKLSASPASVSAVTMPRCHSLISNLCQSVKIPVMRVIDHKVCRCHCRHQCHIRCPARSMMSMPAPRLRNRDNVCHNVTGPRILSHTRTVD